MKINLEKIMFHLEEIYSCGKQGDGEYSRVAYSAEDIKGREKFMSYFIELGLNPTTDAAGNIIVRLEGKDENLPSILIGSHLDTVPSGGKYDGVLGCVAGLGICEVLMESNHMLNHPLEIIVFTDEEGFRFGNGLLGSSAFCGVDPHVSDLDIDVYGQTRSEVMKAYGISVSDLEKATRRGSLVHCFLELHIEQGASLYKNSTSIGVVSSIAGVSRYEITVSGQANHSGSTMMCDRKDALVAAAGFIAKVPEIVSEYGQDFTVATVGTIKAFPNSVNVIPSDCTFNLEIRDPDSKIIRLIEDKLKGYLEEVCKKQVNSYSMKQISYHDPAPMADWVKDAIKTAANQLNYDYAVIPSGAFHDSLVMSSVFPTGMIFIPSVEGISHASLELSLETDIEKGCNLLLQAVLTVDNLS